MLKDYPILINGQAVPWPAAGTWTEEPGTVENVNTTEAGTDQVIVVRRNKFQASASWNLTSFWARRFRAFSLLDSVTVSVWDALSGAYAVHTCRVTGFSAKLAEYSEQTAGTDGLWAVSLSLVEF